MLPASGMEDEEGPEFGKADFVLLDQVTMEDFMENLKLRWAWAPVPFSLVPGGGGEPHTQPPRPLSLGHHRGTWRGRQDHSLRPGQMASAGADSPDPASHTAGAFWTPHHPRGALLSPGGSG